MILFIHSYPGANEPVKRHWEYYKRSGCSRIIGVAPVEGQCEWPEEVPEIRIGDGKYMNGDNLPKRLMETVIYSVMKFGGENETICIAEYDTIFLRPVPDFKGVAAFRAGGQTFGSKASCFYHNPWMFDCESGERLAREMRKILDEGHCGYGTPESSPDVFFGYACERLGIDVQQLLYEYSRNTIDNPQYLEEARQHIKEGCHVVHGVKTKDQLEFITS